MGPLIQRVNSAAVHIEGQLFSSIDGGLLVFVGFEAADTAEDLAYIARKLTRMRIFPDAEGAMNLSIKERNGGFLVISQFTLHAQTKKGNRPSFYYAAAPSIAIPLYEQFLDLLWNVSGLPVKSGQFGADMQVGLVNDGPVTLWIDSKAKV